MTVTEPKGAVDDAVYPVYHRPTRPIDKERYTSREWLKLEIERMWSKVWQWACREEELPNPGDFYEYKIADQSILIIRQGDGSLKAVHNVCAHRGRRLLEGRGTIEKAIRCRFHGWCFGIDGANIRVTDREDFDPKLISPQNTSLAAVKVDTWDGFVFINLDHNAEPLMKYLSPVPELCREYHLDKMRLIRRAATIVEANWKTVQDAFFEGYHIQATHPSMLQYTDETKFTRHVETFGRHGRYGTYGVPNIADEVIGQPSSRLHVEDHPEPQDVMAMMVHEFADVGLMSEDDIAASENLMNIELPEGMTVGRFFANMRRQVMEAQGIDTSEWTEDQLVGEDDFAVFPNFTGPFNPGNALLYRFLPSGTDPDSCIFEINILARVGDPSRAPEPEYIFVEDWHDYKHWGYLLSQDFENLPYIQKGMHSVGFTGLRLNRQEGIIDNFHRALEEMVQP